MMLFELNINGTFSRVVSAENRKNAVIKYLKSFNEDDHLGFFTSITIHLITEEKDIIK